MESRKNTDIFGGIKNVKPNAFIVFQRIKRDEAQFRREESRSSL